LNTTKQKYDNTGIVIIDDFLDSDTANKLHNLFGECNDFDSIDQVRENHYNTVIKNSVSSLPDVDEVYTAKFNKSTTLNKHPIFQIFMNEIKSISNSLNDEKIKFYTKPLCYKMNAGNHMRTHVDLYAGEFGYTYYLTKNWKWDWGGIVNYYIEEEDTIYPILPKFNRLVLRNEKIKLHHHVSVINEYALENRYTINGWGSIIDLTEQMKHKTIGDYSE
jgi:hypothetical protein